MTGSPEITLTVRLRDGSWNVTDGVSVEAFEAMSRWLAAGCDNDLNVLHNGGVHTFARADIAVVELRAEFR